MTSLAVPAARRLGYQACHSAEGSPGAGPSWKGLARWRTNGETVTASDAHLRESIEQPDAVSPTG